MSDSYGSWITTTVYDIQREGGRGVRDWFDCAKMRRKLFERQLPSRDPLGSDQATTEPNLQLSFNRVPISPQPRLLFAARCEIQSWSPLRFILPQSTPDAAPRAPYDPHRRNLRCRDPDALQLRLEKFGCSAGHIGRVGGHAAWRTTLPEQKIPPTPWNLSLTVAV